MLGSCCGSSCGHLFLAIRHVAHHDRGTCWGPGRAAGVCLELGSLLAQAVPTLKSTLTLADALPRHRRQAMENFFAVPRYRGATLHQEVRYKYSGVLVRAPQANAVTSYPQLSPHPAWHMRAICPKLQARAPTGIRVSTAVSIVSLAACARHFPKPKARVLKWRRHRAPLATRQVAHACCLGMRRSRLLKGKHVQRPSLGALGPTG